MTTTGIIEKPSADGFSISISAQIQTWFLFARYNESACVLPVAMKPEFSGLH